MRGVGVYVASRASVPERSEMWRSFRDAGAPIVSTWIDEAGEGETECNGELWQRIEREVTNAARLVLYVEPDDFPLKGALVEVGMAIAAGIPVIVVAPGIELHPHTMRPLGSWSKHPLVSFSDDVESPLCMTPPSNAGGEGREVLALLPCPFDGRPAYYVRMDGVRWAVRCAYCHVTRGGNLQKADAALSWNTRPARENADDRAPALVEAAVAEEGA